MRNDWSQAAGQSRRNNIPMKRNKMVYDNLMKANNIRQTQIKRKKYGQSYN